MTSTTAPVRKRSLSLLFALLAVFAMVAASCGDDDTTSSGDDDSAADTGGTDDSAADDGETPADEPAGDDGAMDDEPFRIAMVAPSASNDAAFSQSMFDAINAVGTTRNIEVAVSDGLFVPEDAAAAIRGYAEEDYDLVVAHGSQYGALLQEIAPDFPDVAFAWGTAGDTFGLPNVSAYSVSSEEGGYVMGAMAAEISQNQNIGVVGPFEVGDAALYVDGFKAGAEAQKPGIDVNVNYIESFGDVALAQEAAEAFLTNGADVLTGTAQMVVGATTVASSEGIPWFGTQSNQTALGPDVVVASQVYHWEVILEQMIDEVKAGNLGDIVYLINLAGGGLEIEFNDGYPLDPAIKALGEELAAGIADGSVEVNLGG